MTTLPLRTQEERLHFCEAYFGAVGATVLFQQEHYYEYQLPRDVDKDLTDRPYYWIWVEHTHQDVAPSVLRVAFSKEALERENTRLRETALVEFEKTQPDPIQRMFFRPPTAELLTLGCYRLDKLFESVDKRGKFACVAPAQCVEDEALIPWLCVNFLVSYRCDVVEQSFLSVGVCLVNGQVIDRFLDRLCTIPMRPWDKQAAMTTGNISLNEGFRRAQHHCVHLANQHPQDWATEAVERLEDELMQLRTYYHSVSHSAREEDDVLIQRELEHKERQLIERAQPRVEIRVKQMSIVGLRERPSTRPQNPD